LLLSNYPQHCKFGQQELWTAQTPVFYSWPISQECTVSSQDQVGAFYQMVLTLCRIPNLWDRQGSMGSPTICWGLISTKLIETQEADASGAVFTSPDKSQSVRICSVSFVDDTNAAVNIFHNEQVTPEELLEKATADAQRWNDLLAAIGGASEIPKCKFHLAFYQFSASRAPVLTPLVSIVRDGSIMEIVFQSALFSAQECKTINYCRQFLQVHTLSDLTLAGGTQIDPFFLTLSPSLLSSQSTLLEPIQDKPLTTTALASLWVRANRLWCNTVSCCLHQPLGKWLSPGPNLRQTWPYYYDSDSQILWCWTIEDQVFTVHCSASSSATSSHPTSFHLQPTTKEPLSKPVTLPAQSFPVQCKESWSTIDIQAQSSIAQSGT
jgi:hypothetical protein